MKAIKCADCGSTNTEYGVYELAAYRSTVLDDRAKTAADAHCVEWKVSQREQLEGFVQEHFMCNDCFATVDCESEEADKWIAVEINNDREEVSNA